ncbi:S-adenosyl-L-methionine-dependent methyltransferase [Xylaria digitata]|nr:S-adenosyl-L-methionine-dependent methyltransferase [Xylaria digitata]
MNSQGSSVLSLAEDILEQAKAITHCYQANNVAVPTFPLQSSDPPTTPEYQSLQNDLRTSIEDLQRLVEGPRKFLRSFAAQVYDLASFQIALDFEFFTIIPAEGEISFEELSNRAGLDLDRVSRLVRMLITFRFFEEKTPGFISHSSSSIVLLKDEELRCTVHYTLDELFKAAADSNVSLKSTPFEADNQHCPFKTRHGLGIFEWYNANPHNASRFAKAMAGATRMDRHINELRDCFPWGNLRGTVVDIGGGSGHISMTLAKLFPHLKFVVQDQNEMLIEGQKLISDKVRDRMSFQRYSFFDPQPFKDAAAFFICQCTHNWCDRDVVTIFKSMVPGLESSKPGTPFLINDIIMPEPGIWPRLAEREVRQIDIVMLVGFGAKQRIRAEFLALLTEADPRYEIRNVYETGPRGLLEVYLVSMWSENNSVPMCQVLNNSDLFW